MNNPVEIMARAMRNLNVRRAAEAGVDEREVPLVSEHFEEIRAAIAALEAAGIRLLSAEGVTDEMVRAFVVAQTLDKPWEQMLKDQIVAAIRAAPVYSKEKL